MKLKLYALHFLFSDSTFQIKKLDFILISEGNSLKCKEICPYEFFMYEFHINYKRISLKLHLLYDFHLSPTPFSKISLVVLGSNVVSQLFLTTVSGCSTLCEDLVICALKVRLSSKRCRFLLLLITGWNVGRSCFLFP